MEDLPQIAFSYDPLAIAGSYDPGFDIPLEGNYHSSLAIEYNPQSCHLGQSKLKNVENAGVSGIQLFESSEQTTIGQRSRAVGSTWTDFNGDGTYSNIHQVVPNSPLQSVTAPGNQYAAQSAQSDMTAAIPITIASSSQNVRTGTKSRTPDQVGQPTESSRGSERSMVCDRVGCEGVTFRTNSLWR